MAQNGETFEKVSIDSGSIVQADTGKLLSVGHYVAETATSSSLAIDYATIDKQKTWSSRYRASLKVINILHELATTL